jgi:hypothetical protein
MIQPTIVHPKSRFTTSIPPKSRLLCPIIAGRKYSTVANNRAIIRPLLSARDRPPPRPFPTQNYDSSRNFVPFAAVTAKCLSLELQLGDVVVLAMFRYPPKAAPEEDEGSGNHAKEASYQNENAELIDRRPANEISRMEEEKFACSLKRRGRNARPLIADSHNEKAHDYKAHSKARLIGKIIEQPEWISPHAYLPRL